MHAKRGGKRTNCWRAANLKRAPPLPREDKRFLRSKRGFFLLPPFSLQLPREPISCQFFFLSLEDRWQRRSRLNSADDYIVQRTNVQTMNSNRRNDGILEGESVCPFFFLLKWFNDIKSKRFLRNRNIYFFLIEHKILRNHLIIVELKNAHFARSSLVSIHSCHSNSPILIIHARRFHNQNCYALIVKVAQGTVQ